MITRNGWSMLVIPAIAPEDEVYELGPGPDDVYHRLEGQVLLPGREPEEVLDLTRRALGTLNFSAQYQQAPVPAGGAIIRRDWVRFFEREPSRLDRKIVSWDTASTIGAKADFSVGTVWGVVGLEFYLLDLIRGRFETPELRRRIVDTHRAERAHTTLIENTELGRSIAQDLRRSNTLAAILPRPRHDKAARLMAEAPKFEAGQVWVPREAAWLGSYPTELIGFPSEKHDDQVDSTTQALKHLTRFGRSRAVDETGNYGPTGRRTRASLTRRRPEPPQSDDEVEIPEDSKEPIVRRVPADWEPSGAVRLQRRR